MSLNPPNAKQIFATCGLSRQTSQRAIHYWFGINSDWLSFRPGICGALTKRSEIASDLFVLSRRNRGGSKNLFELTRVTDLEQTIAIATRQQSYNIEISLSTGVICLDLIWSSGWVMSWKGLWSVTDVWATLRKSPLEQLLQSISGLAQISKYISYLRIQEQALYSWLMRNISRFPFRLLVDSTSA